jgi:hypothetical protein
MLYTDIFSRLKFFRKKIKKYPQKRQQNAAFFRLL